MHNAVILTNMYRCTWYFVCCKLIRNTSNGGINFKHQRIVIHH